MKKEQKKFISKIGKAADALYWLLFVSLASIAILVIFTTLETDLPFKIYTVQSGSMSPKYDKGTVIFVAKSAEYTAQDVITFKNPDNENQTITHRVIAKEYQDNGEFLFTTKGDANEDKDAERISKNLIVGKVRFGIPLVGYLISFARTRLGVVLLVVIPTAIFVVSELKNLFTAIKIYRKGGEVA